MAKGSGAKPKTATAPAVTGTARTTANKARRIAAEKARQGKVKKMRVPRGSARRIRRSKDERVLIRRADYGLTS